jgi:hypothetical protein
VEAIFALGHNAFQIVSTGKPEQSLPVLIDVIAVQQSFTMLGHDGTQPKLTANQGQVPQVLPVTPEQIENVQPGVLHA